MTVAILAGLLLFSTVNVLAQSASLDYPQWRGQARDGSASGFVAPKAWPDKLSRKWKVEVGEGYATPLIVGSTIYLFVRQSGDEGILAIDAGSGRTRWRSMYPAPFTPARPAAAHGAGPKATPLFQHHRLFTLGVSGIVSAFDAKTGKILWQTPAPKESPFYGAASSPVGYGNLVITHPGYEPLTAFDEATGAVKWIAGGNGFFTSPMVMTFEGTPQIVSVLQDSVIGVSTSDGTVLWKHPWQGGNGSVTPAFYNDMVIVTGSNAGVMALRPRKRNGAWTVDKVWETSDVDTYTATPVVARATLFGLSVRNRGQFFALDAATGETLWLGEPRAATNVALVHAGDALFYLTDDRQLIVTKADRDGFQPIRRYTVADSPTWAQPLISGKRIFIKDTSSLALWTY